MATADFFALIDRLGAAPPEERTRLEAQAWERFGVERAMLVLDMSHFSVSVRRGGILPYLALIRRMQRLTRPLVEQHGGQVVKYVADNMIAAFEDTRAAVDAAIAIIRGLPPEGSPDAFSVSLGIDHGRLLLIGGEDCYGDAVNMACKLGEDLACPREILLTAAARAQLGEAHGLQLRGQSVSVSGIELQAYSVILSPSPATR